MGTHNKKMNFFQIYLFQIEKITLQEHKLRGNPVVGQKLPGYKASNSFTAGTYVCAQGVDDYGIIRARVLRTLRGSFRANTILIS